MSISLFSSARTQITASVVVSGVRALLGAGAALAIAAIVDRMNAVDPTGGPMIVLAALLTIRAAVSATVPLLAGATAVRVETDLRRRVLSAVTAIEASPLRRTGEVVGKTTEGIEAVAGLGAIFLPQLFAGMTVPLLLGAVVAFVDPLTALVLLGLIPVTPALLRMMERRFASVSGRYRATADRLAARFLDGVQGLRTLKAVGRSREYGEEIASEAETLRVETMGLLRVNQLALLAVDTLFTLGTVVAATGMAAWRAQQGAVTAGEAVAIVLLGLMLIEPLTLIGRFFYVGAIGRAAAAQIRELLGLSPGEVVAGVPAADRIGEIRFEEVSFTYPNGLRAVDSLSLQVEPGERVALVGPSGAGKTTAARLMLGLLQPDRGTVRMGGRAILVPQQPFLFHGSIADNLRLARPGATASEMWEALEAAEMAALVADRSDGLTAPVGDRGLRLSGGEIQRLAIARALLVDAPIVVLDEPTSNVDLETETRIKSALERLMTGRTVVLIAHRRSTVAGADRILLMEDGRLTASGTPSGESGRRILAAMSVERR